MEITFGQLLALKDVMNNIIVEKMPKQKSIDLGRFLTDSFNVEFSRFDTERQALCNKYCKKDEAGKPVLDKNNQYTFEVDGSLEFVKEYNELVSVKVELTFPFKSTDDLPENISTKDIMILREFKIID